MYQLHVVSTNDDEQELRFFFFCAKELVRKAHLVTSSDGEGKPLLRCLFESTCKFEAVTFFHDGSFVFLVVCASSVFRRLSKSNFSPDLGDLSTPCCIFVEHKTWAGAVLVSESNTQSKAPDIFRTEK